jgi:hypothetical protein
MVFRMDDSTSQEETRNQFILLSAAPKETSDCIQPHVLLMQLEQNGGGFIELASGGKFITASKSHSIQSVGSETCDANKFTEVYGNYLIDAKKVMFVKSKLELSLADTYIVLGAGQDCEMNSDNAESSANESLNSVNQSLSAAKAGDSSEDSKEMGPCIYPIIIAKKPKICPLTQFVHWTCFSDRVLASASKDSQCP